MIKVIAVDYHNTKHTEALLALLDEYALHPMGGGQPLDKTVHSQLIAHLQKIPTAISLIAWVDDQPAALLNAFEAFSTFKCQPLINIHDIVVSEKFKGRGLSQTLLDKIEQIAIEKGCCKLTLEVLEGNQIAQNAYRKFGFSGYELDPKMGKALFWEKPLNQK